MMKIYPQLELHPIFETSMILFNMSSGAIILNEKQLYSYIELVFLTIYAFICIIGVFMLVKKVQFINQEQIPKDDLSSTGSLSDRAKELARDQVYAEVGTENAEFLSSELSKIKSEEDKQDVKRAVYLIALWEKKIAVNDIDD